MTSAFAELLAEKDDPERVEALLEAEGIKSSPAERASSQPTLSELYERYLKRRQDRSPATRAQYKRTIPDFLEFSKKRNVKKPDDLSTEVIDAFVDRLFERYEADSTVLTYTKNIRAWLSWLESRSLCDDGIYCVLDKDELGLTPAARDEALPEQQAQDLLENLRQKRFGRPQHALLELCWNGGPRLGGLHSLDICDFDGSKTEVRFRHRPEAGTRLKNGSGRDGQGGDGERVITISGAVVDAIQQYINCHRPDVTDNYGRKPLFTTAQGRASRTTLRRWLYEATSCRWTPESSTQPNCDGNCDSDSNVCPQSYCPHAIRRGAIVNHLSGGLRYDKASERFNVSPGTIDKHYDPRSKRRKKEDRADAVREAWSQ